MWKNNKQLILIDAIDDCINEAEGELDYVKCKLVEFLNEKDFDLDNFSIRRQDIYDFLIWYERDDESLKKISMLRCKQIINFMFCSKLK